jgi:hypothetical protein
MITSTKLSEHAMAILVASARSTSGHSAHSVIGVDVVSDSDWWWSRTCPISEGEGVLLRAGVYLPGAAACWR